MLKVITCTCGGADRTARETLRRGGIANPLKFPVVQGKNKSQRELETIPAEYKETAQFKALKEYVAKAGRFVIVIGYGNGELRWSNVSRGTIKEKLDGELIVEHYKDI